LRSGREHWAWMVVVEVRQRHCGSRVAVEQEGEEANERRRRRRRRRTRRTRQLT